ncbi:hypothetical protein ACRTAO_002907 [Clostridium perfringens]
MFSKEEFQNLVNICNKLESNNSKINKRYNELRKISESEYYYDYYTDKEIASLINDSRKLLKSLDKEARAKILAVYFIGSSPSGETYKDKLERARELADYSHDGNQNYVEGKLITINEGYLKNGFDKGVKYIKDNCLIVD